LLKKIDCADETISPPENKQTEFGKFAARDLDLLIPEENPFGRGRKKNRHLSPVKNSSI
jgi:hypothetical protein